MGLEAAIVDRLPQMKVRHLATRRNLANRLRWWTLRTGQLIEEIRWKIDPWKDAGMY